MSWIFVFQQSKSVDQYTGWHILLILFASALPSGSRRWFYSWIIDVLTPLWWRVLLPPLVCLCCLRLACSCARCCLMCCRLHNASAWTCWFCTDSLLNTLASPPSTHFVPILSTAWASLSVRQIHTFEDSDTPREKSLRNECTVPHAGRYCKKSLVRDWVQFFIWSEVHNDTVKSIY